MNRYRSGGPSKASATTLCQKCLGKGHYNYECSAAEQQRPYTSRPSRTQQLLNPKLVPKITNISVEPEPKRKQESADAIRSTEGRGKRGHDSEHSQSPVRKRARSISSSSDSVVSISTRSSRSPAPLTKQERSGSSQQSRSKVARHRSGSPTRSIEEDASGKGFDQRPATRLRPDERKDATRPRASASHVHVREQTERSQTRRPSTSPYSQRIALTKAKAGV